MEEIKILNKHLQSYKNYLDFIYIFCSGVVNTNNPKVVYNKFSEEIVFINYLIN